MFGQDHLTERTDKVERVFDGNLLKVDRTTATLPNGKTATRETVRHIGAVAILPVDSDGMVVMEKQYRTAVDGILLEVPAGKLDSKQEDRLLAAKRELREETGLVAQDWTWLCDIWLCPGYSDEKLTIYLAQGLSMEKTDPDEDEFIDIVRIPFAELLRDMREGRINDGKTICALALAEAKLAEK